MLLHEVLKLNWRGSLGVDIYGTGRTVFGTRRLARLVGQSTEFIYRSLSTEKRIEFSDFISDVKLAFT